MTVDQVFHSHASHRRVSSLTHKFILTFFYELLRVAPEFNFYGGRGVTFHLLLAKQWNVTSLLVQCTAF